MWGHLYIENYFLRSLNLLVKPYFYGFERSTIKTTEIRKQTSKEPSVFLHFKQTTSSEIQYCQIGEINSVEIARISQAVKPTKIMEIN